jgi:hypothetical protein
MAARDLELEIARSGRPEASFDHHGDPDDTIALRAFLISWLESRKWAPAKWGKFELRVRYAGEWTVRKRVRA